MSGNKRGPYAVIRLTPNRIREHCIARGLTQADLARALGLSPAAWNDFCWT